MKSDSKSGLKIKQIIMIVIIILVLGTSLRLFSFIQPTTQVAQIEIIPEENSIQEEIQVADINYERDVKTTTRSAQERTIEQVEVIEQKKYITIDEITISKNMDLTIRCGVSKEDFKTLMQNLKSDTSGFFYENSDTIYDLCEKYELNEMFFCGLIAAESGWNISSNHRNKCNYISMMSKGSLIRYSSTEEGLEAAAKLLHNKYLTEGGSCYYGKTLSSVQKRFCPNSSTWVNLVYGCMKQIVK